MMNKATLKMLMLQPTATQSPAMKSRLAGLKSLISLALLAFVLSTSAQAQTQLPYVLAPEVAEEEQETQNDSTAQAPTEDGIDAQQHAERFVIYVVRHAEKEDDHVDPGLTRDGYRRADGLAQLLKHAGIEAIYSTFYRRNVGTALPLARELATPIEFYQANEFAPLVDTLFREGRNALVVGHSNTVADIVNALGGSAQPLDEDTDYGDVFQLIIDTRHADTEVVQIQLTAPLLMDQRRR